MSPIFALIEGLRFYFYSKDLDEPPHTHVGEGSSSTSDAKIWLDDLTVARTGRFNERTMKKALRIAEANQAAWLEIWKNYERNRR